MPSSRLALVRGEDRYNNISQALEQIASEVDLSGKQRVLIKPNFVVTDKPLAVTHAEAMRAVLDFVRARYDGPLTIGEGPSARPAAEAFRLHGYEPLAQGYDASLVDLNHDQPVEVKVYDWRLRPLHLHLARTIVDSDFRISVGPPKTHDVVIVTLSLKNMIMGSLISHCSRNPKSRGGSQLDMEPAKRALWRLVPLSVRNLPPVEWFQFRAMSLLQPSDKARMHQSYPIINLNLALIAPLVVPHLAVLDGFEAMEGNGPTEGDPVPWRLALAGTDALAIDTVATTLMGFDPDEVGYLHYCRRLGLGTTDPAQMTFAGNASLAECRRSFRPHLAYHRQLRWHLPQAEQILQMRTADR